MFYEQFPSFAEFTQSGRFFKKWYVQGRSVILRTYYEKNQILSKKVQSLLARRIILNELTVNNGEKCVLTCIFPSWFYLWKAVILYNMQGLSWLVIEFAYYFVLLRISTDRLKSLAAQIKSVFPEEDANTYYFPYTNENGETVQQSGKLFNTEQHYRSAFKEKKKSKRDSQISTSPNNGIPINFFFFWWESHFAMTLSTRCT